MSARLALVVRACGVRRFHMHRVAQAESVGEHSFMVAQLARELNQDQPLGDILACALDHDLPEGRTGDIPEPVKRMMSDSFMAFERRVSNDAGLTWKYSVEVERIVKLADVMAGYLYCRQEVVGRGNMALRGPLEAYQQRAHKYITNDHEQKVLNFIEGAAV